jgi:hypothetical protein
MVVYHAGEKLKIRTSMLLIDKGAVQVICRQCGEPVPIDLQVGSELSKALADDARRLVIAKKVDS